MEADETYWIGSAYYYHLAFEKRDWTHPDWQLLPALENPPVAKYVIGFGLALTGRHIVTLDGLGGFYAYFKATVRLLEQETERIARQAEVMARMDQQLLRSINEVKQVHVDPGVLVRARYVMVVCGAITSLLVFLFGSSIADRATGLVASQLMLWHPNVRDAYEHAMSDAAAYMFGTAAALAVWLFLRRFESAERAPSHGDALRYGILAGATVGIAAATKMNWLTVTFLFAAVVLFLAARGWRRRDRSVAIVALTSGAVGMATALLVYVLVNPAILLHPVDGLVAAIREPRLTTELQVRLGIPALEGIVARVAALSVLTTGTVLTFLIALVGIAVACVRAPRTGVWFVAAWFAIAFIVVTAWIPFKWSRYSLPAVIPFTLLLAHALTAGVAALVARSRNRVSRARDARTI